MSKETLLTGITTSGTPHLGNFVGAIRPAIAASRNESSDSFYFLADFHSLIKCQNPELVRQSTKEVAATWLALGLDTDRSFFYRQSDIPEIAELTWILNCMAAKGLMNRAHAYKAAVAANEEQKSKDPDKGISMGLYSYPVLMAADILMFKATKVPVGRDQVQHIEMTRDIAQRFNHHYKEVFVLPEAVVDSSVAVLAGLDGRKMSKSYNNTIPLFVPEKKLRKLIMKIKTDSSAPGDPKDPDNSTLFEIYQAFAKPAQVSEMRVKFEQGISWGDAKQELFEIVNEEIKDARDEYNRLLDEPSYIEEILLKGAEKARKISEPLLREVRDSVGISRIS